MTRWRAAVLVAALAASASAGVLTDAAGVILVNGRESRVDRRGFRLEAGDRLETVNGGATIRSAAGDDLRLDPATRLRFDGTDGRTELYFLSAGAAEGRIGPETALGAGAGWAMAPAGATARVRVRALGGERGDATYACTEGSAWVRYHGVSAWIPARASVTLRPGAGGAGSLGFEVPAGSAGTVEILRTVGDGTVAVLAWAGASGVVGDAPGGKAARVTCTAAAPGALVRVEDRRGAGPRRLADLGPGAAVDLDGRGGALLVLPGIAKDVLPRLLAQNEEFTAPRE